LLVDRVLVGEEVGLIMIVLYLEELAEEVGSIMIVLYLEDRALAEEEPEKRVRLQWLRLLIVQPLLLLLLRLLLPVVEVLYVVFLPFLMLCSV
jgi:choline-glycine betaine transporter